MQNYNVESTNAGWDSPKRAQELVSKFVTPGSTVLDIGTGTGLAVEGYSDKGVIIIGIDNDQQMLNEARKVTGTAASLRLSDINETLPTKDLEGAVDVVQAIGVLEFADNLENVIEQVHGVLKRGGVLVFTIELLGVDGSNSPTEHYPDAGVTVHRHSPEEVTDFLTKSGFRVMSEQRYDGYSRQDSENGLVPYGVFLAQSL